MTKTQVWNRILRNEIAEQKALIERMDGRRDNGVMSVIRLERLEALEKLLDYEPEDQRGPVPDSEWRTLEGQPLHCPTCRCQDAQSGEATPIEPTCDHAAPSPNARWCSKCGALYDGAEWLFPSNAQNRPAEPAEDAKDAARYRWLCDGHGYFMEEEGLCGHGNEKDAADKEIDEAMRRAENREAPRDA